VKILKVMGWLAALLLVVFGSQIFPSRGWDWLGGLCVFWYLQNWLTKALAGIRATSEHLASMAQNTAGIAADVQQLNRRGAEMPLQRLLHVQLRGAEAARFGVLETPKACSVAQTAGTPIKPVFGDRAGETWAEYQEALEKYQSDRDEWFFEEGRRALPSEVPLGGGVTAPEPSQQWRPAEPWTPKQPWRSWYTLL
jgi:hypothetical protein